MASFEREVSSTAVTADIATDPLSEAVRDAVVNHAEAARTDELRRRGLNHRQIAEALEVSEADSRRLCEKWRKLTRALRTLQQRPGDLAALHQLGVLPNSLLHPLVSAGISTLDQMAALSGQEWSLIHQLGPLRRAQAQAFLAIYAGPIPCQDDVKDLDS